MAWRNQGITGSNNIPLVSPSALSICISATDTLQGNRRRFGGDTESPAAEDDAYTAPQEGYGDSGLKRGRSPVRELNPDGTKKRKKRNRWGEATENKAAGLMNLPTAVLGNMTSEQLDAYTLHLRIEEISQKLRINDVVPAEGDRYVRQPRPILPLANRVYRSPSPPPQYDNFGRRVNTREYRYKKRLEDERHKLIEKAMKVIPGYHPPSDYRRPTKTQEKVYVPVNDYPEINFSMLANPLTSNLTPPSLPKGALVQVR